MEKLAQTEIEQLRNEIRLLEKKVNLLIDILMRLGTELRNSRDRGAFHAGNYLGGVIESLQREDAEEKKDS